MTIEGPSGQGFSKFQGPTIRDYFVAMFACLPARDLDLGMLPMDSACGEDCLKVIDAGAALVRVVDPASKHAVIKVVEDAIAIYWIG